MMCIIRQRGGEESVGVLKVPGFDSSERLLVTSVCGGHICFAQRQKQEKMPRE